MNAGRGPGQLPLALGFPPDQRLDTYVVGARGDGMSPLPQLAALAANPHGQHVFVSGAPGTGKTHLAIAACAASGERGGRPAYVHLPGVAARLREALEHLHEYDLVALDGLDAIAGDDAGELALFDFHNRVQDAGGGLLYTARAWPAELGLRLPDLVSRLAQCVRVPLRPLDDASRGEVLRLRARRRGLQLDPGVIDWLLRRTGRDLGNLAALLDRLDRASLAAQRRVTLPFLRQVLEDEGR